MTTRDLRPARFVGFPRDEVLGVGAPVFDDLALVEVQDARDGLVEQREVVTHDEQRPAERPQERHQPGEQHEVTAREQDPRELRPPPLTA